jgi:uncharacterized membrane protein YozB (DUF420 family)
MALVVIGIHDLPMVNACLNGTAAVLLVIGYALIRNYKTAAHKRVMIAAFVVSCLFLVSYLVYHYNVGSVKFDKPGWVRTLYLSILTTHTILAGAVPVLAILTLRLALKGRFVKHRALARWTFPIWLYVSVTGVIVYVLLYQVRPRL